MMKAFTLLLSLLLLVGCQNKPKKETGQSIRLNIFEDPVSFDPRHVRTLKDLTIVKQLYEGLTRLDKDGIPQPAIAKDIIISEDGLTYTFYLREAYWNNQDPVVAHDFVRSWTQCLDPSFASDYCYMLDPIKNARLIREGKKEIEELQVSALDDSTLVVQLEMPTPYFLELTAFPTYFPVHQGNDKNLVYNGPFQLEKWTPQNELILEKNPFYWEADVVKLHELCFSIIDDTNTESLLFQKGELDWLGQPLSRNIPTDLLERVEHRYSYPVAGTFWLSFNTCKEPFTNSKIRKAFSYAIDRDKIIFHILKGQQKAATSPIPDSMALQRAPYFQDGNLEEAQRLFSEALRENGWSRQTFPSVSLNYISSERNKKLAQYIKSVWEGIFGIKIKLAGFENHVYRQKTIEGFYQVGMGEWVGDFNDPIAFLELFNANNTMNYTGWENEAYSELINRTLHETNSESRKLLLQQAEKILVEEMPIAPLYHYAFDYVKIDALQNVILSPLGLADFKYASINHKKM